MSELKTKFSNSFVVMPDMCNFRFPQIFGGAFMAQIDLCAAACATQLLQFSDSICDNAVTYKITAPDGKDGLVFHKPAELGNLITLDAEVVALRNNSITVFVKGYKQNRLEKFPEKILCVEAYLVFVTLQGDKYRPHGLSLL